MHVWRAAADDFLPKPIRKSQLESKVGAIRTALKSPPPTTPATGGAGRVVSAAGRNRLRSRRVRRRCGVGGDRHRAHVGDVDGRDRCRRRRSRARRRGVAAHAARARHDAVLRRPGRRPPGGAPAQRHHGGGGLSARHRRRPGVRRRRPTGPGAPPGRRTRRGPRSDRLPLGRGRWARRRHPPDRPPRLDRRAGRPAGGVGPPQRRRRRRRPGRPPGQPVRRPPPRR